MRGWAGRWAGGRVVVAGGRRRAGGRMRASFSSFTRRMWPTRASSAGCPARSSAAAAQMSLDRHIRCQHRAAAGAAQVAGRDGRARFVVEKHALRCAEPRRVVSRRRCASRPEGRGAAVRRAPAAGGGGGTAAPSTRQSGPRGRSGRARRCEVDELPPDLTTAAAAAAAAHERRRRPHRAADACAPDVRATRRPPPSSRRRAAPPLAAASAAASSSSSSSSSAAASSSSLPPPPPVAARARSATSTTSPRPSSCRSCRRCLRRRALVVVVVAAARRRAAGRLHPRVAAPSICRARRRRRAAAGGNGPRAVALRADSWPRAAHRLHRPGPAGPPRRGAAPPRRWRRRVPRAAAPAPACSPPISSAAGNAASSRSAASFSLGLSSSACRPRQLRLDRPAPRWRCASAGRYCAGVCCERSRMPRSWRAQMRGRAASRFPCRSPEARTALAPPRLRCRTHEHGTRATRSTRGPYTAR